MTIKRARHDDGDGGYPVHNPKPPTHIPAHPHKYRPIFSTPPIPVADSVCSRCRMDRERFEPGGRECPGGFVLTQGAAFGEAVANVVPLAGGVFSAVQSQPPGRGLVPKACHKRAGRDDGAGLWRTCLH